MLLFKKEKRRDVLKGRTIRYLTNSNNVACTEVHLSNILNGKIPCGPALAKDIVKCVGQNARIEDYFIKIEK